MPEIWKGADGLREFLVPVGDLERHPRNPRRGQVDEIAGSLQRFGQVRPILANGRVIVAGNHTFLAAQQIGWTHIAAIQHEFANEQEARAYLLADNRLPELGTNDTLQLMALLEEAEQVGKWEGTGYDPDYLDDLRALHGTVPETEPEPFTGGYALTAEELAAREQQLSGGSKMSELVLTLTGEQTADFELHMKVLSKEYGLTGATEVIARAVHEAADRIPA